MKPIPVALFCTLAFTPTAEASARLCHTEENVKLQLVVSTPPGAIEGEMHIFLGMGDALQDFKVIYSFGRTLIAQLMEAGPWRPDSWQNLIELTFANNGETSAVLKLGERLPPRNMMGKYVIHTVRCD